jgi:hypothetical protein
MSESIGVVLRWCARISAVLVSGTFLFLAVGEILYTRTGLPTRVIEWFTFGVFIAALASMLLAWKWEATGALVSLACLAVFAALVPLPDYVPVAIAAIPGVLFLADWLLRRLTHTRTAIP